MTYQGPTTSLAQNPGPPQREIHVPCDCWDPSRLAYVPARSGLSKGTPFGNLLRALLSLCSSWPTYVPWECPFHILGPPPSYLLFWIDSIHWCCLATAETHRPWVCFSHPWWDLESFGFKPRYQEDPFHLFPSAPHNAINCLQRYGIETG